MGGRRRMVGDHSSEGWMERGSFDECGQKREDVLGKKGKRMEERNYEDSSGMG